METAGIALKTGLIRRGGGFAGWRVNYDTVLRFLAAFVMAPPARWSSDRMPAVPPRSRVIRRRVNPVPPDEAKKRLIS